MATVKDAITASLKAMSTVAEVAGVDVKVALGIPVAPAAPAGPSKETVLGEALSVLNKSTVATADIPAFAAIRTALETVAGPVGKANTDAALDILSAIPAKLAAATGPAATPAAAAPITFTPDEKKVLLDAIGVYRQGLQNTYGYTEATEARKSVAAKTAALEALEDPAFVDSIDGISTIETLKKVLSTFSTIQKDAVAAGAVMSGGGRATRKQRRHHRA